MCSGFPSKTGTQHGGGGNKRFSGTCTPASRNGRATPEITPKKTPLLVEVAFVSFTVPWVGATTVSDGTNTRIAWYFSSCCAPPFGSASAAVSVTGVGRELPVLISET